MVNEQIRELQANKIGGRKRSMKVSRSGSFGELGSNPLKMGVPKRIPSLSGQLESKVFDLGGIKPIHSVLVANNGMAAVKFIRSVQDWAYKFFGHEHAVAIVAMATPEDMQVDAEHIKMADQFVEVPGGSNNNNYANVRLIVQTAEKANVDAVWPGWGHASEKPELPAALAQTPTKIQFLGPSAEAMAALGDKVGSTILAQAAGVPTLPWSGSNVSVSYKDCRGIIPVDVYKRACVHSVEETLECCNRIQYPCMLKASWGGGGKGIRKVGNDEEVRMAFKQVQGEVPGSPIFAMKLAPQSRHLEVQLLCDQYGNVVSLFSRDCSVQRRHQKIVEEGPVTKAPPDLLHKMEACARELARSVGYVGAATVEFLYGLGSKQCYFLELNPRLQVEHPVTEWISGVNIPSCQLMIGMGIRLERMPDIRRLFGQDPEGCTAIDFERDPQIQPMGAVLAVRVTSEDANDGFKPTCGVIDELNFRNSPDVWGYFSVKSGGGIHEFSDSQFGHLFAKGDRRESAIRAMVVALKQVKIRGEIRTSVDYTTDMIQHEAFTGNNHHTGWLDSRIAAHVKAERPVWYLSVICGALLRVIEQVNLRSADYLGFLEKGQLPPARLTLTSFEQQLVLEGMKYTVKVHRRASDTFSLSLDSSSVDAVVRILNDGGLLVQVDGLSHVVHSEEEALGTRITIDSLTCLLANESDPSRLVASSPGKLIRYLLPDGSHVNTDQPYAELEVMKMMMPLLSSAAGHLHFHQSEASVLNPGDLIATLDLDDPEAVTKAEPYAGGFPDLGPPLVYSSGVDHRFKRSLEDAKMILAGYEHPVDTVVTDLTACLGDSALPLMQFTEAFAVVQNRMSSEFVSEVEGVLGEHEAELELNQQRSPRPREEGPCFPARALLDIMNNGIQGVKEADRAALAGHLKALMDITTCHLDGGIAYTRQIGMSLFEAFLDVEERFQRGTEATEQEIIDELRQTHSKELQQVLDIVVSHQALQLKCSLVVRLLYALVTPRPEHYRPLLRRLAALVGQGSAKVASCAQQLLEHSLLTELQGVVTRTLQGVDMFSQQQLAGILGHTHTLPASHTNDAVLASKTHAPEKHVARRSTFVEGLYSGLVTSPFTASADPGQAPDSPFASRHSQQPESPDLMEVKLKLLVEAPAAVEDALASLLNHADPEVQRRALLTYIKRIYYPFLQQQPSLHSLPSGLIMLWTHTQPAISDAGAQPAVLAAAVVIPALANLAEAATPIQSIVAQQELAGLQRGTLHVILTEDHESALVLSVSAQQRLPQATAVIAPQPQVPDLMEEVNAGAGNRRAVTAAVIAQLAAMDDTLAQSGFESVSVLVQRPHMPPVRCGFWRAATSSHGEQPQSQPPKHPQPPTRSQTHAEAQMQPKSVSASPLGSPRNSSEGNLSLSRESLEGKTSLSDGKTEGSSGLHREASDGKPPKHRLPSCNACSGALTYGPDVLLAAVEPFGAQVLELQKLDGFRGRIGYSPTRNRQCHMYTITERPNARSAPLKRVFLRGTVHTLDKAAKKSGERKGDVTAVVAPVMEDVEEYLVSNLVELERAGANGAVKDGLSKPDWAHVFLTVIQPLALHQPQQEGQTASALRAACAGLMSKHSSRLRRAGVVQWEVRLSMPQGLPAWRVVVSSPTGHEGGEEDVQVYQEALQAGHSVYLSKHTQGPAGAFDGTPILAPYPPLEQLQQKRLAARRHKTTFAYDFPSVFGNALRKVWQDRDASGEYDGPLPARCVDAQELVMIGEPNFRQAGSLQLTQRPIGCNTVGVVAWLMLLRTPECPDGRQVVAVANDITYNSGAFGPKEDAMFRAATEYALQHHIPVFYLAANSGARVGLANEVKQCLKVEWHNSEQPQKGFSYLYLSDDDYHSITDRSHALIVKCEEMQVDGTRRWKLTDVVGEEDGLGIECLSGSGAIASVYARAFREGFTVTLVSGRTVGIGAYLARLGRRCIQRADQPIILTGFSALNKLLGREVYSSQMQLGGPKVMAANGVSHHIVEDDLAGVEAMLKWLAFVPPTLPGTLPVLRSTDPIGRQIEYEPDKGQKLDARAAIAGRYISLEEPNTDATASTSGRDSTTTSNHQQQQQQQMYWESGLFDKDSWVEAHPGWAKSVVTGRARLGGMPCGVIGVETQTVMLNIPADPGMPDSMERTIPQAGQVWFPDSALKTAQAIEECDREQLPLVIMANWRGFSGGQRDLFEGVLQAGSLIVDNLRTYHQPVIVYLSPGAELRGGAWVVIDGQINPAQVEMYADPGAAGGVLEPEGIVEIKYRTPDLIATMHRLDPRMQQLKAEGAEMAVRAREQALLAVYRQMATTFAQMHDSPVRMVAKGVLRGIVPWHQARPFLTARLRRRVAEEPLIKAIMNTSMTITRAHATKLLQRWFYISMRNGVAVEGLARRHFEGVTLDTQVEEMSASEAEMWADDDAVVQWVLQFTGGGPEGNLFQANVDALQVKATSHLVQALFTSETGQQGILQGLQQVLGEKPQLKDAISSLLNDMNGQH